MLNALSDGKYLLHNQVPVFAQHLCALVVWLLSTYNECMYMANMKTLYHCMGDIADAYMIPQINQHIT